MATIRIQNLYFSQIYQYLSILDAEHEKNLQEVADFLAIFDIKKVKTTSGYSKARKSITQPFEKSL